MPRLARVRHALRRGVRHHDGPEPHGAQPLGNRPRFWVRRHGEGRAPRRAHFRGVLPPRVTRGARHRRTHRRHPAQAHPGVDHDLRARALRPRAVRVELLGALRHTHPHRRRRGRGAAHRVQHGRRPVPRELAVVRVHDRRHGDELRRDVRAGRRGVPGAELRVARPIRGCRHVRPDRRRRRPKLRGRAAQGRRGRRRRRARRVRGGRRRGGLGEDRVAGLAPMGIRCSASG